MDSMKELEKQVERLLGEVTDLRRNNRLLVARAKKLEKAQRDGATSLQSSSDLRHRVERLVRRLEELSQD